MPMSSAPPPFFIQERYVFSLPKVQGDFAAIGVYDAVNPVSRKVHSPRSVINTDLRL